MTRTRGLRTPLIATIGLGAVLTLTGCSQSRTSEDKTGADRQNAVVAPSATPSATTSAVARPQARERTVPPKCRGRDPLAVGRAPIESGLGHRYLRIDVRNCSSRPLQLDRPMLTGTTGAGRTSALRLAPTPVANRAEGSFTLGPGDTAHAGVEWLAEPRHRRIRELRVTAANSDTPDPIPIEELEMRLSTRLDYYPWISNPDDVF